MATVRKRSWKTSKGECREAWLVDYFDQGGVRRFKNFDRKKDADDYLTTVAFEVRQGTHTADSASVTVGEAGEKWIERGENAGLTRSTVRQYRNHLKHHINPYLGRTKLSRLSVPTVRDFENKLRQDGRSDAMVKKVLSSLSMLLGDAQDSGLVSRNVVRERSRSRKAKTHRRSKIRAGEDFPTVEEARAILEAAEGRWRPLVTTTIITGMRMSELRGLTWADVDFDASVIHVRQRADEWGQIDQPKSAAGERVIPMGEFLSNTLKAWKLEYPRPIVGRDEGGKPIRDKARPEHLVFSNGAGKVESHANIYRRCFAAIQLRAGVSDDTGEIDDDGKPIMVAKYGPHAFRHYAVSTFIDMGYPPKRVQDIAGHSTLTMTMDTYGHLFPDPEGDADMMRKAELRLVS